MGSAVIRVCYNCERPVGTKHDTGCPRAREEGDLVRLADISHANGENALRWCGDPECKPTQNYHGDAGYDLVVAEDVRIPVGGFANVDHGIGVEFPPRVWGLLTGRSSTIRRRQLLVVNGIIDNGYRGELFAAVANMSQAPIDLHRGERIAQLILFNLISPPILEVAELRPSERDIAALGSTGR